MDIEVRPCSSHEELAAALDGIGHYFGTANTLEDAERFALWADVERVHAAWDGDRIVGATGALTHELSVPGGALVPCAGVTIVGVQPTHRRRGILRALMREQLDDVRRRGEAVAWLWASEASIYARFGYGLASLTGDFALARERTAFARPLEPRGVIRLVDAEEALEKFPPIHEAAMRERPGMFRRSRVWWETRRLTNPPHRPTPPLNRALLELDGEPAAYAVYRVNQAFEASWSTGDVDVVEAMATSPQAHAEIWRFLLDMDWTSKIKGQVLPVDHPLFLLLSEPRRMSFVVNDGVWVRLVDVGAALSARGYAASEEAVVLDVRDGFLPENAGRWRVADGRAERADDAAADLALDVADLGSVYLGGFAWRDLRAALRVEELTEGAVERADRIFGDWPKPWCPEIF